MTTTQANPQPEANDDSSSIDALTLASVFGDETGQEQARKYWQLLATDGIERGFIGPREIPRLWERHLLNSAVMAEVIAKGVNVLDIGSGAGLPGIPVAIARPDLHVTLVEPMERRSDFLNEAMLALKLRNVDVVRAPAQEVTPRANADVVISRAVAPLGKLAGWCLPLLKRGGEMLALKGRSAAEEIERDRDAIAAAGGGAIDILTCGEKFVETPTTIVRIIRKK